MLELPLLESTQKLLAKKSTVRLWIRALSTSIRWTRANITRQDNHQTIAQGTNVPQDLFIYYSVYLFIYLFTYLYKLYYP